MEVEHVLIEILVVLIAAKLAAEVSHRVGIPTVVGEILAGVLVGPSVFNLISGSEVIDVLAELGVILLLMEVGMHMDISDLGSVGGRATLVALLGVAAPLAGGFVVARGFGVDASTAVFVGAALTATSVGITARVFGDLRMLNTLEGRTVLGAAVADDVIGLIVLAVVSRSMSGSSASTGEVFAIVGAALGIVILLGGAGLWLAPRLLDATRRMARSKGTFSGFALAFVLLFALAANSAGLAPIIGAFVAGLCIRRTLHADVIKREFEPLGHLFVPVFFLQIGTHLDLGTMADSRTLAIGGALIVVATAGKLIAGTAMMGTAADKMLVGLGMLPRGEVGLIFAAIGFREGFIPESLYGSLVAMVMVTTLAAPSLLRWKVGRRATRAARAIPSPTAAGTLRESNGVVELEGQPPTGEAAHVVLAAAAAISRGASPGPALAGWVEQLGASAVGWDAGASRLLLSLLRDGDPKAWSFLASSGLLDRLVPELAHIMRSRAGTIWNPDPLRAYRWDRLERLSDLRSSDPRCAQEFVSLEHEDRLTLAALVLDSSDDENPVPTARRLAKRLDLGARAEEEIAMLVADARLLGAAAKRGDGASEESVLQLASHLRTSENARALYLLTLADDGVAARERAQLDELHSLLQRILAHPELSGREIRNSAERRRAQAIARADGRADVIGALSAAPRRILLAMTPAELIAHGELRARSPHHAAFDVRPSLDDIHAEIVFVSPDRGGLLARTTAVLASRALEIERAVAVTWPDGIATQSFVVSGDEVESADLIEDFSRLQGSVLESPPLEDAKLTFDPDGSPWYTLCEVETVARPRVLHDLIVSISSCSVSIWSAQVTAEGGTARFHLELLDGRQKLDPTICETVRRAVNEGGRLAERARFRQRLSIRKAQNPVSVPSATT